MPPALVHCLVALAVIGPTFASTGALAGATTISGAGDNAGSYRNTFECLPQAATESFQYNPESLQRTIPAQGDGGGSGNSVGMESLAVQNEGIDLD